MSRTVLERLRRLELAHSGAISRRSLDIARHGSRRAADRAVAEAQSDLFDRLARGTLAAIQRRRRNGAFSVLASNDPRMRALTEDLAFYRRQGVLWHRRLEGSA